MLSDDSKTPQTAKTPAKAPPGAGDALESGSRAATAVATLVELRRLGFEPARLQVGDVVIDLVIRTRPPADAPRRPEAPRRGPVATYLGDEAEQLLNKDRPRHGDDDDEDIA